MIPPQQVGIVGLGVERTATSTAGIGCGHQPELKRIHDGLGNLVLHRKDVTGAAIEALRPEVQPIGGLDELGRHPQVITGALDAAFEHRGHPELAADFPNILAPVPERKGRGTGGDTQSRDIGKRVDQRLGDTVAQIGAGAVGAQVDKGSTATEAEWAASPAAPWRQRNRAAPIATTAAPASIHGFRDPGNTRTADDAI